MMSLQIYSKEVSKMSLGEKIENKENRQVFHRSSLLKS